MIVPGFFITAGIMHWRKKNLNCSTAVKMEEFSAFLTLWSLLRARESWWSPVSKGLHKRVWKNDGFPKPVVFCKAEKGMHQSHPEFEQPEARSWSKPAKSQFYHWFRKSKMELVLKSRKPSTPLVNEYLAVNQAFKNIFFFRFQKELKVISM